MERRVFIGSAGEDLEVAHEIRHSLKKVASATVWDQGVFELSKFTLESLQKELAKVDFGVFVLTPTDVTRMRQKRYGTARDNVIFELGLFLGRLGRDHCFIITPKDAANFHLPSDLAGITAGTYDPKDKNRARALKRCCTAMTKRITKPREIEEATKRVIGELVEATARLCALRAKVAYEEVRGFVHLFDSNTQKLKPLVWYAGLHKPPDVLLQVPCSGKSRKEDWYIISRAFRTKRYLCGDVNWAKVPKRFPGAEVVSKSLRAVAACPIAPLNEPADPIGTICCDSSKRVSQIGWNKDAHLQDILSIVADAVYSLLSR